MPGQQEREPISLHFIFRIITQDRVAHEEVKNSPRDDALAGIRFEFIPYPLTTLAACRFTKIFKIEVWNIAAKTITATLTSEEMVYVTAHRFFVRKPGLRHDMLTWGYCKVEDALSAEQVEIMRDRVLAQAEGERLAGIAQKTPSGQNINCCINKGRCFELFIEQHPDIAQGGPLVEQLVTEALGPGWICTSLIAALSLKGGVPQALHQDQGLYPESASPMSVNILTAITDIDETNGGTLLIPGSHLTLSEAAREGKPVGKLPPAINLDAKAGTMVITDGRLLHLSLIHI